MPASLRVGAAAVAAVLVAAIPAFPAQAAPSNIAGKIVFLDPGHQGSMEGLSRQVPTGRGGTKECQTSGTSTTAGFPEHSFTWNVVLLMQQQLANAGVQVHLSRNNDNALGPCVDQRAEMANSLRPNAVVSVHADGGPAGGRRPDHRAQHRRPAALPDRRARRGVDARPRH